MAMSAGARSCGQAHVATQRTELRQVRVTGSAVQSRSRFRNGRLTLAETAGKGRPIVSQRAYVLTTHLVVFSSSGKARVHALKGARWCSIARARLATRAGIPSPLSGGVLALLDLLAEASVVG